jgi:hypothetical protein
MELSTIVINSAAEANAAHREGQELARAVVYKWFAIGAYLNRERSKFSEFSNRHRNPEDRWLVWLEVNITDFSRQQADIYMRLDENRSRLLTVSNLESKGQRELLDLCEKKERAKPEKKETPKPADSPPKQSQEVDLELTNDDPRPPTDNEDEYKNPWDEQPEPGTEDQYQLHPIGFYLYQQEHDLARAALNPSNQNWEKAAITFFSALRKREIETV